MKFSQLSLLLLSDIHLAHEKLKLLTHWHFEHNLKRFDYVLISGDFGNIKMETDPSEAELALEQQRIAKILKEVEEIFNA